VTRIQAGAQSFARQATHVRLRVVVDAARLPLLPADELHSKERHSKVGSSKAELWQSRGTLNPGTAERPRPAILRQADESQQSCAGTSSHHHLTVPRLLYQVPHIVRVIKGG
jgi:hypothetical protein